MSEQENTLLRNEIARLNRLLEALLTANEALRREISLVKGTDGQPSQGYSIETREDGITKSDNSIVQRNDGNGVSDASIVQRIEGANSPSGSIEQGIDGINKSQGSTVHEIDGTNTSFPSLPPKLDLSGLHIHFMHLKLKTGDYIKVSDSSLENQTKMLINFYNGGSGSHKELRKLTGLSKGGMAKSIMSLTKRGLIVRTGFQKFSLTGDALKILETGWEDFSRYTKSATTNS